jgi:GT2 family glycosyltransferase
VSTQGDLDQLSLLATVGTLTQAITEPLVEARGPFDTPAVIVVNFGSSALLRQNLGSISWADSGVRVVVVDNYSTEAERQGIRKLSADMGWELVEAADNRGFGAAVNLGIETAISLGSTIFTLINPDAQIEVSVASALFEECKQNPMAMVAPKIIASDGSIFFDGAFLDMCDGRVRGFRSVEQPSITRENSTGVVNGRVHPIEPWLTGACVALSRELYDRIGGMDDRFFLYWEDIDLSYRARRAGAALIIRSDLTVIHDEGGTQGERRGRAKSNIYYYYNCRNRLLFAAAHLSRHQIARWAMVSVGVSWAILKQGGRRQLTQSPGPLLSAISGTLAGLGIAIRAVVTSRPSRDNAANEGATHRAFAGPRCPE